MILAKQALSIIEDIKPTHAKMSTCEIEADVFALFDFSLSLSPYYIVFIDLNVLFN